METLMRMVKKTVVREWLMKADEDYRLAGIQKRFLDTGRRSAGMMNGNAIFSLWQLRFLTNRDGALRSVAC